MSPASRVRPGRTGFTLIELIAVLVLVGLISATAMLRFSSSTRRATFEWSLDRVVAADQVMRTHATSTGQAGRLRFEIGRGRLERIVGPKAVIFSVVDLGERQRITRFLAAQRHVETGTVEVPYDPEGHSETFALEIEGPADQSAWILFAGLTGQTRRFGDRRDVERILELIRPAGPDAG